MVAGIVLAHLAAAWGLLQGRAMRDTAPQTPPLFVSLITPSAPAPQPTSPAVTVAPPPMAPVQPWPVPQWETEASQRPAAPSVAPVAETTPPAAPVTAPAVAPQLAPVTAPAPPPIAPAPAVAPERLPAPAVQFLEAPVVVYPRLSRRHGESGVVVVRAYVGVDGGAPRSVQLSQSSGHPRLDEAALAAVQKARFKPSFDNGRPVEGWALIPIHFELEH